MASFDDLPTELVHNVAYHLAPTCCRDSKQDILAFRAVERRTWLVANKLAFKYMTLYVQDPARCTKLGTFGQKAKLDLLGCDIRSLVQEVWFLMPPEIHIREYACSFAKCDKNFYKQKARRIFLHLLQKEEPDLSARERKACQYYWKLCIKPYIVGPFSGIDITQRITDDLKNFPNVRTMNAGLGHHILNTSSIAWRALEQVGITSQIYDKLKDQFHPLPDGASLKEDLSIDYSSDRVLKLNLLRALPPSVTSLKCNNGQDELNPEFFMDKTMITQITEFDAGLDQRRLLFLGLNEIIYPLFPNLQTLHLRSGLTKEEQYGLWGDNCYIIQERIAILPKLLSSISSLVYLETLHVNGYVVSIAGFIAILKFAASHKFTLILENMMLIRVIQKNPLSLAATEICDFWPRLSKLSWSNFPEYMSSGQIHLKTAITCVSVPLYPGESSDTVVEHSLSGSLMAMFQEFMHTGENADSFCAKLSEKTNFKEIEKKVDSNTAGVIERENGSEWLW